MRQFPGLSPLLLIAVFVGCGGQNVCPTDICPTPADTHGTDTTVPKDSIPPGDTTFDTRPDTDESNLDAADPPDTATSDTGVSNDAATETGAIDTGSSDSTLPDEGMDWSGCVADCSKMECGPDPLCGEDCGDCEQGHECSNNGQCVPVGMALIPAGKFWMGCGGEGAADCGADEYPYHEVNLSAYYIDKTEVTLEEYEKCQEATACARKLSGPTPAGTFKLPVTGVTWYEAKAYCTYAGKRLPTEAEWEKAARGTDERQYPWGNDVPSCDLAVLNTVSDGVGCGTSSSWAVCSRSPAGDSPYGLCDMVGNLTEWVADSYLSDYYKTSPTDDPTNVDTSNEGRVLRGSNYLNYHCGPRISDRAYDLAYIHISDPNSIGFRCAKSL